jgi:PEP-CTERM/exosortase A-associated glycosyltransferase
VQPHRGTILHLLTNSLPEREAGYTLRAQRVARCQADVGLDPRMVTRAGFPGVEGRRRSPAMVTVDGIPYHRIDPDHASAMPADELASRTAHGLARLVGTIRPAALHPTTNYVNAQAALAVGEAYGIPVVYEVRGFLEETWVSRAGPVVADGERYLAARAAETDAMRRAAAVVTLSETMRDDILARGGIDPARVHVVPNAVDVDAFRPGPRDPGLAASLGIAGDEPVVGYISSFSAYEGISYLIEAVALLRARGRRVRLLLVGDGDEMPALRATADRCGLTADGGVVFTGRVPHTEVAAYYRLIDVFVVPRTADRVSQLVTPLKPYEAMAMEKALVVSGVDALLEIVRDGETGAAFRPEDPVSLAATIEPLLDDPGRRTQLGIAARAWVTEHRTWTRNGARYLELYRELGVA